MTSQTPSKSQAVKEVQNQLASTIRDTAEQQNKTADAKKEQPKPVVNTQGQTIGTRLNVSA